MSLGNLLRTHRIANKMTVEEVAKRANLSTISIYGWETDKRIPTIRSARKLSLALGLPYQEIAAYIISKKVGAMQNASA